MKGWEGTNEMKPLKRWNDLVKKYEMINKKN